MVDLSNLFPKSALIKDVQFDKFRLHKGDGDMWPLTWAADNNIYAGAGDNMGSPMNLWRIEGSPFFFASTYNDKTMIRVYLHDNMPVDPEIYATYPEIRHGFEFKPSGILSVDGTIYFTVSGGSYGEPEHWYRQRYTNCWISTSTDSCNTWNHRATPEDFFTGRLAGSSFLQFGKDYEGARDEYVYNYFPACDNNASYWENNDYLLLGRVKKDCMLNRGEWEFYTGKDADGNPLWNRDDSLAKPVFEYPQMTGQNHVAYDKGIGRYIMGNYGFRDKNGNPRPYHINDMPGFTDESRFPSELTLFEAPEPWGPWSMFYKDDNWGTYGDYQPNFPTKWMSEDGKTLYMVSSGSYDDYNFTVQKLTLILDGDKQKRFEQGRFMNRQMDSKQRGISPFKGFKADRIPMWYGASPETTNNLRRFLGASTNEEALYDIIGIDYKYLSPKYIGAELNRYEDGSFETIWGIKRGGYHYGQALNHPLANAETIREVESHPFPKTDDWDIKLTTDEIDSVAGYSIFAGIGATFFHDAMELLGTEKFMMDMYMNPGVVEAVLNNVVDFYLKQANLFFKANPGACDIIMIHNDFGAQKNLLVSPAHWRQFIKPHMVRFAELAHRHGLLMILHSCGDVHEIIPDLIDAGVDALNPIQVNAQNMDPVKLKAKYANDIVFFGGIDENEILAHGSVQQVRVETRRIIDVLGYDGKYIAAPSHDYLLPEIPAENIAAMYDEVKKYSSGV